jgi:hypothetical protein
MLFGRPFLALVLLQTGQSKRAATTGKARSGYTKTVARDVRERLDPQIINRGDYRATWWIRNKTIAHACFAFLGLERLARSIWRRARNFGLQYQCPMCRAHLKAFLSGSGHHACRRGMETQCSLPHLRVLRPRAPHDLYLKNRRRCL